MNKRETDFVNSGDDALVRLRQKGDKIRPIFASEAWAEWLEWAELLKDGLRDVALRDMDVNAREEARVQLLAFEKFEKIPFLLAELLQEGQVASDIPSDPHKA